MLVELKVNGLKRKVDIECDEYLVDTLRKIGNLSVKRGCDTGCCGLCSIWIDKKPTLSCATLTVRALNKEITTIEGLSKEANEFAKILVSEGAEQCGLLFTRIYNDCFSNERRISKSYRKRDNTLLNR